MHVTGSGILYLVATPIGNLEDLSARALRVLREVDLVAAEDTRHTRRLLQHFGISARTCSPGSTVHLGTKTLLCLLRSSTGRGR